MPTIAEAIGLPFDEASEFFRQKARIPTNHWTDVWRTAHSRGFMVAGAASDALLSDFQTALQKAFDKGTTQAEFRGDFDAIVARHGWVHNGSAAWRSRIIYETNLSTAYSAGRYAQMTEPDTLAMYPYWQYVHSGSRHPRLQHLAWNGLVLRADDPFWASHYPPNGWRCGCRVRPVSHRELGRMGKSGPDTAPPIETRPWRNPKTGEVLHVPVGIDPGFDYNPGMAWKQGGAGMPVRTPDLVPVSPADPQPPPHPQRGASVRPTTVEAIPPPFESGEAGDAVLTPHYAEWKSGLSEIEQEGFEVYKGRGSQTMNGVLRDALESPALAPLIDAMVEAMKHAVAPMDMTVFRGVRSTWGLMVALMTPGTIFTDPGFSSTSLDEKRAREFMRKRRSGRLLEIVIPKGYAGAAYVHDVPAVQKKQFELLLAPGARFRVLSQTEDRTTIEVLP
jgi:hypothetical protein